ncbi:MAG: hypothetical protein RR060_00385 [Victivallaceae bacterium]
MSYETLKIIPPQERCIVSAANYSYVWGVFMLLLSIRRWEMAEPIILGVKNLPAPWMDFLGEWPNVTLYRIPPSSHHSVCIDKPLVILQAKCDYVTWIDSDGIFTGNCSDYLYGEPERLYSRTYTAAELAAHPFARSINTLIAWQRDVNDLVKRREVGDICTNVVGLSLSHNRQLVEKWIEQMLLVLPSNSGTVGQKYSPYFQTDESVMNSLLSYWSKAPALTECYRLNNLQHPFYAHFAYNPKPWQSMWTSYSLRYYQQVMELLEWARQEQLLPGFAKLPPTLRPQNASLFRHLAPLAPQVMRIKKLWRVMIRFPE